MRRRPTPAEVAAALRAQAPPGRPASALLSVRRRRCGRSLGDVLPGAQVFCAPCRAWTEAAKPTGSAANDGGEPQRDRRRAADPDTPHRMEVVVARPLVRPRRPEVPRSVVSEVWAAEDGRCEFCGRPMDRGCTRVSRRVKALGWGDPRNLALLCCDCERRQVGALRRVAAVPVVLEALPLRAGVDRLAWVRRRLDERGVDVPARGTGDLRVWVPTFGHFDLRAADGDWTVTAARLYTETRLAPPRPQALTRGLPRPDRGQVVRA